MTRDLLKKLVIGGAIVLSAAIPVFGQQGQIKPEKKVVLKDPFVPPKNLDYLSKQPERTIDSLDALAKRLEQDGVDRRKVMSSYSDERFRIHSNIYDYFKDNPENTLPYPEYRQQLGLDKKIENAPGYFKEYAVHLFMAEDRHLVEAPTILATMGVESDFQLNPGKFRAFNAGVSLYLTPKNEFAYRQLKALFDIEENADRNKKIDIMNILASYAVCSFPGQFLLENIPVDFVGMNNNHHDDLFIFENWFYAIAHYMQRRGWDEKWNYQSPTEGSVNWQVLLRYNKSNLYARAVVELADSLKNNPEIRELIQEHQEFRKPETIKQN